MNGGDSGEAPAMEELVAGDGDAGRRVDLFISANAPDDLSRARVQALVRQGLVTINGAIPRGTSTKISAGDIIRFAMPQPEEAVPEPEDIPLDILLEDDDLIVVNKPAGMVVHPAPGNWSGTLVNALLYHCKGSLSGIGGVRRPGIVHRLDKGTSGVMVAAKSYRAHLALQEQFADHGRTGPLVRHYLALVWGKPGRQAGRIETFLGRHPTKRLLRAVVDESAPDAKHAVTRYEVMRSAPDPKREGEALASLVQCVLETGRTHQIRVHMAHAACPLIGDPEYGRAFFSRSARLSDEAQAALAVFERQALHAHVLGFAHPASGEAMLFEAPMPDDMQALTDAVLRDD